MGKFQLCHCTQPSQKAQLRSMGTPHQYYYQVHTEISTHPLLLTYRYIIFSMFLIETRLSKTYRPTIWLLSKSSLLRESCLRWERGLLEVATKTSRKTVGGRSSKSCRHAHGCSTKCCCW